MKSKEELKSFFENGDIPKQDDFWEWQDSYWHKNEKLPLENIDYDFSNKADLVDGKIPATQLPSYVDDILEFDSLEDLPNPGEKGKIYVITSTNTQLRWSGSEYVPIISGHNVMITDSPQDIFPNGTKTFWTDDHNNSLHIKNTNSEGAGITFDSNGIGQIVYNDDQFRFTNSSGTDSIPIVSDGFVKSDSSNDYVLTGGGGHKAISDFVLDTDLSNYVTINTPQTIESRKIFNGAIDNSYSGAAIMVNGNQTLGLYPTIGFHQPGNYAGTISYKNDGRFHFMSEDAGVYRTIAADGVHKAGSSDSYVLTGGGSHKPISDFVLDADLNNYQTTNTSQNIDASKSYYSTTPFTFKNINYKSWVFHKPSSNNLIFAPSLSNNGDDFDWANQIEFTDSGFINAQGFFKKGSDASHILLGNGGHKLISDFATAGNYVTTDTPQVIIADKSFSQTAKLTLYGNEFNQNNNTQSYNTTSGNGNIASGWVHTFYDSRWKYGIVRGGDGTSNNVKFGFDFSSDGGANYDRKLSIDANSGALELNRGGNIDGQGNITIKPVINEPNATGLYWKNKDGSGNLIASTGIYSVNGDYHYSYIGWGPQPWITTNNLAVGENIFTYKDYEVFHQGDIIDYPNSIITDIIKVGGTDYLQRNLLRRGWSPTYNFYTELNVPSDINNTASFILSQNGNGYIGGNQIWNSGNLEDYHQYGLGTVTEVTATDMDAVSKTSILGINDGTANRPVGVGYGSVLTHRKSATEFTQLATEIFSGQLFTRGKSDAYGFTPWRKQWDSVNFDPDSKVNKSGDIMTGTLSLGNGANLRINGVDSNWIQSYRETTGNVGIVAGFEYAHYATRWKVGNKRGGSIDSLGYCFEFSDDDGANYTEKVRIQPDGNIATESFGSANLWNSAYQQVSNKVDKSGDTMTGNLKALTITATKGTDKLIYDNIENWGSPLRINANASLGVYLQANGTDILYVGPSTINAYRDLHMESGTVIYTTTSNSDQWERAYKYGLVDRGAGFVSNVDANNLGDQQSAIISLELGNGTGNTNFPKNDAYGNFLKMTGRAFTSEFFHENNGSLYHRNWYYSGGGNPSTYPFRKIWDDVNLDITKLVKVGGINDQGNSIYLAWTGSNLQLTVDTTTIGNVWTSATFNPTSKANALQNATGIGFTSGDYPTNDGVSYPYIVHDNPGSSTPYIALATQGYVTTNYTPISHVGSGGTAHANATTSTAGFMSSADKTKLDNINTSNFVTINTTQTVTGSKSFADGSQVQFLGGDGNHIIPQRTPGGAGTIVSGHDYTHYNTRWRVGNVRGGSTDSTALGFFFSSDNGSSFSNRVSIDSANGQINTAIHGNSAEWNDIAQNGVRSGNNGFTTLQNYREIDDSTFDIDDVTVEKFNIVFNASANGRVVIHSLPNGQTYHLHNFSASNILRVDVEGYGNVDNIEPGETKVYMAHNSGHLRRISSSNTYSII